MRLLTIDMNTLMPFPGFFTTDILALSIRYLYDHGAFNIQGQTWTTTQQIPQ